MSWYFTPEQREFQKTVRQIMENRVKPLVRKIDTEGVHSPELIRVLAENNIMSLAVPEEYGGSGPDVTTLCIALEEMGRIFPSAAIIFRGTMSCANMITGSHDEDLKKEYLGLLASGKRLGAICMTEPTAGSDAVNIKTTARRDGDHYIINGEKCFISNTGVADVYAVMALTDPSAGAKGSSAFIVTPDIPGFRAGKAEKKMGLRGSVTGSVYFEDVRVPARNRIGDEGEGFSISMRNQNRMRMTSGAVTVGMAAAAIEHATQWARTRIQFNRPIGRFQGIQFMLADMEMQMASVRALLYETTARMDAGEKDLRKEASMVKCIGSDMAMKVTTDAVQIFGGYGLLEDYPVEMLMRDAKGFAIFTGTNQIQRAVIARSMLGREVLPRTAAD